MQTSTHSSLTLVDCFAPLISRALDGVRGDEDDCAGLFTNLKEQADACRKAGQDHGYSAEQAENGLFAVVCWIDELVMSDEKFTDSWVHYLLQKALFNTTNGGDEFYERFNRVDPEDTDLNNVFLHCLVMGFRGRMYDEKLFNAFCQETFNCESSELIGQLPEPLFNSGYPPGKTRKKSGPSRQFLSTFFIAAVVSAVILGALYYMGHHSLDLISGSLNMDVNR